MRRRKRLGPNVLVALGRFLKFFAAPRYKSFVYQLELFPPFTYKFHSAQAERTFMRTLCALLFIVLAGEVALAQVASAKSNASAIRFITLDPGHFHASLVHKEMYPGVVSPQVHIYAPLGPDLLDHLGRLSLFNHRAENPTTWQLEIHTSPDF